MREIFLTQGKVAIVDDEDYPELSKYKWHAWRNQNGDFYAVRSSWQKGKKTSCRVYMHRQILGLEIGDSREGDHRNHNTLDYQRDNLRICTHSQNMRNQKISPNKTSKFKGVSWCNIVKKWVARIYINAEVKNLGYWDIEEIAALRYDMVAIHEFGDFACLNFN